MSVFTAIRVSRAPFAGLGIVGLYWGTMAAMMPVIKAQAGASDAAFGLALLGTAVAGMATTYIGPFLAEKLGRFLLTAAALGIALAMQMTIFVSQTWQVLPMMVVMGLIMTTLDIGSNMRISQLEERHGLHLMNVNHAMFSLCFGGAALFVAYLRQYGLGLAQVMPLMAVVIVLASLFTWEGAGWRPVEKGEGAEAPPTSLPWLVVLMTSVMLFVSFIGENTIEAWSALFIERTLGGAPGEGGFGPSTLGFVMFFFRLIGQVTTERLGEERVVFASGVLGVIGLLVLATAPVQSQAIVGIAITAVGMAVIVPTANSLLGKMVHREQRALAISRAWLIGFSGFFVGPALIGFLSELFSLRVAFACVSVLVASIIPAVIVIHGQRKGRV
ncbi:MAG: MFS transporter [Maritimibacter sp.]